MSLSTRHLSPVRRSPGCWIELSKPSALAASRRTEKAYVAWIRRDIFFHDKRHPAEMEGPEVTRFLTSLAVEGKVSASTQNQALAALLFLDRAILGQDLPWLDESCRPAAHGCAVYGAGLRLLECARLRVKDFAANQIVVRGFPINLERSSH